MDIFINVYWLKVKIRSENQGLSLMIQKYYEIFLVKSLDEIDVEIGLNRYNYFSKAKSFSIDNNFITYWDSVKIDPENSKYFFTQQEVSWIINFLSDGSLKVEWKLIPNKIRHIVHIALQGFTRIDKYYNRFLIKTCIHDIIFVLLEKKLKTCILHATAVTNGKNTYLFTWLWGSGKSTLASTFSKLKGYTILSDNYAIVSGNTLYPFPELPRITKWTQSLLGINLKAKADGIKNYLENNLNWVQQSYDINKIFICSYSENFILNKLDDSEYIFELLYSINNYTKEFPEYLNLALMSVIHQFNTNKQRINSLNDIVKLNDFYLIQNNKDLKNNINKIMDV